MHGPTILKATDDKTRQLNDHTLMTFSGEPGDTGITPPHPAMQADLFELHGSMGVDNYFL